VTLRRGGRRLRVEHLWGTAIGIDVRDGEPADRDHARGDLARDDPVDLAFQWFRRVDELFSTWRPESEISRLGRGELGIGDVSPEVRCVLHLCEKMSEESGGAFDITVGADPRVSPREGLGTLDPSGLVKGWALDQAAELLRGHGLRNFSLNAGGDVVICGRSQPGRDWRVGIQHPWIRDRLAAVVGGTDMAVATSGRYERGEHIIDPRSGRPPSGLMAVTVVAGKGARADGLATAAIVLGNEAMPWLAGIDDVEAMAITESREVVLTEGFARLRCE